MTSFDPERVRRAVGDALAGPAESNWYSRFSAAFRE
jgi:hypothetical protein